MFSRTIEGQGDGDEPRVLEFGVTGALYNANVLMYDRTDRGLWSQMAMKAVSGPRVGTELTMLPTSVMSFGQYLLLHPSGKVVSQDTGSSMRYDRSPYADYFAKEDLMVVPVKDLGTELPKKTLGMGILAGDAAYFVPAETIGEKRTIETALGKVVLSAEHRGDHGSVSVVSAPKGVRSIQTLYLGWSAFYPNTEIVGRDGP